LLYLIQNLIDLYKKSDKEKVEKLFATFIKNILKNDDNNII
jgi:hypothetical protein